MNVLTLKQNVVSPCTCNLMDDSSPDLFHFKRLFIKYMTFIFKLGNSALALKVCSNPSRILFWKRVPIHLYFPYPLATLLSG